MTDNTINMTKPSARVASLLLAEHIIRDALSGKISAINSYTGLVLDVNKEGGESVPKITLVFEVKLSPSPIKEDLSFESKLEIISPSGKIVGSAKETDLNVEAGSSGFRNIVNVGPIKFSELGEYAIKIYLDNNLIFEEPSFLSVVSKK